MILDRFGEQAARIKRRTVGRRDDTNLALRNDRCLPNRNTKEIRMDGPQARRQGPQLDAFDAALFDEGNRVLKIVVGVLRAVGREDSARRHWFAVDCFDNAEFVGADLDQRHLAHDALERILDQMQAGLEHFCLNANFAFGGHHSSRRHAASQIAPLFDRNFARADVDEDAPQNYEQHDQKNENNNHDGEN